MPASPVTYTFLGPEGTFTEAALMQVPGAVEAVRIPSSNVNTALDKVRDGSADAAMVPIENSVEGGVTATLDAIASGQELRIIREALVPISFVLVARPGVEIADIRKISTHGHAWAQCRLWVEANMPDVEYIPASSTAAGAMGLLDEDGVHYDAAICAPIVATEQPGLHVLAENIGDNPGAVTRFVLVSRPGALPHRTGADKTTVVVPLPGGPSGCTDGDPGPVRHPRREPQPDRIAAHRAVSGPLLLQHRRRRPRGGRPCGGRPGRVAPDQLRHALSWFLPAG